MTIAAMEPVQPGDGKKTFWNVLNPLTPMSDQERISPYNINTMSTR